MIAAVIIPSITTGFLGFYLGRVSRDLDRACAAYTTQYCKSFFSHQSLNPTAHKAFSLAPVLKDVKVQYAYTEFNGTFMKEDVYRRKGSPEVDAAWEALGVDYRAGVISVDEGLRSGLSPAHVQRAEKYGGGFFVNVEGLHHLHCLVSIHNALPPVSQAYNLVEPCPEGALLQLPVLQSAGHTCFPKRRRYSPDPCL